ncbi:KxYKxGKxW signal peptide domain-containing protein [Lactiplantibacillus plajomi]|nr:KxYKxGKxW signal peptide domain-containing protein [Lactiplantibacillus plajomi]
MRMVVNEKRHYKMYKKGRLWVIAGITVATVGAGKLTAQAAAAAPVDSAAQAGQTDGGSVAQPKQVTLTAPKVVTENKSANTDSSTPVTPATAAPDESATAPNDATVTEPSSAPASPTSAVTPTSSTAPSQADSGAPTQSQSVGSAGATSAPETDQSAAPTNVAPASKPAAAANKVAPAQPVATKASVRAVEADTGDEDVSGQFEDANLLAAVRKGLKLADDQVLTVNVIKEQKSSISVSIKDGDDYLPVKSLKGLQLLGNLNDGVYVNVDLELGSTPEELRAIDLSPLQALKLNGLHLITDYWRYATDDQLKLIAGLDTSAITWCDVYPC